MFQSLIAPFHSPGSSSAFSSFPFFDLYKVSFLVIEHDLDISSCIHKLSNVIVYRKNNNNEKTDKVLNLLFQSIILSFYTKEYDGLFLDYEDLNLALSFQTNRYLKIEEIKEIENMAEQLKNYKIDAAYTSPILRAKNTSQIILKNHSVLYSIIFSIL